MVSELLYWYLVHLPHGRKTTPSHLTISVCVSGMHGSCWLYSNFLWQMSHYLDTSVAFCLALHVRPFLELLLLFCFLLYYVLILEIYLIFFMFSDTYGLFNFVIPGPSFYSAIESSSFLVSTMVLHSMMSFAFKLLFYIIAQDLIIFFSLWAWLMT